MAKIFLFPERNLYKQTTSSIGSSEASGELVAMRGVRLDATLETVAFLRTLDDQAYLDRFNRVKPVEHDFAVESHRARLAAERS